METAISANTERSFAKKKTDAILPDGMQELRRNGVRSVKGDIEMYTKQEIIEMLNDMKKQTDECLGFIVGTVTKGWVYQMIDEKIQAINNKAEPPED